MPDVRPETVSTLHPEYVEHAYQVSRTVYMLTDPVAAFVTGLPSLALDPPLAIERAKAAGMTSVAELDARFSHAMEQLSIAYSETRTVLVAAERRLG